MMWPTARNRLRCDEAWLDFRSNQYDWETIVDYDVRHFTRVNNSNATTNKEVTSVHFSITARTEGIDKDLDFWFLPLCAVESALALTEPHGQVYVWVDVKGEVDWAVRVKRHFQEVGLPLERLNVHSYVREHALQAKDTDHEHLSGMDKWLAQAWPDPEVVLDAAQWEHAIGLAALRRYGGLFVHHDCVITSKALRRVPDGSLMVAEDISEKAYVITNIMMRFSKDSELLHALEADWLGEVDRYLYVGKQHRPPNWMQSITRALIWSEHFSAAYLFPQKLMARGCHAMMLESQTENMGSASKKKMIVRIPLGDCEKGLIAKACPISFAVSTAETREKWF